MIELDCYKSGMLTIIPMVTTKKINKRYRKGRGNQNDSQGEKNPSDTKQGIGTEEQKKI